MSQNRTFDGTVQWLESHASGKIFPNLVFRGDVDFVTSGLISLTSITRNEIVATMFLPEECCLYDRPDFSKRCEDRINRELDRVDLRVVSLLRTVDDPIDTRGMSFQEYSAKVKPTQLYYTDIYSEEGEALVIREESIETFLAGGGTLVDKTNSA